MAKVEVASLSGILVMVLCLARPSLSEEISPFVEQFFSQLDYSGRFFADCESATNPTLTKTFQEGYVATQVCIAGRLLCTQLADWLAVVCA